MTIGDISNVNLLQTATSLKSQQEKDATSVASDLMGSFQDAIQNATSSMGDSRSNTQSVSVTESVQNTTSTSSYNKVNDTQKTESKDHTVESKDTNNTKDIDKTDKNSFDDEAKAKIDEAVNGAKDKATEAISDTMQVAPEDVTAAMETLGLTMVDVTNPSDMVTLTVALDETMQPIDALMDTEFMDMSETLSIEIGDIMTDTVTDIASFLDIDLAEAQAILEDVILDEAVIEPEKEQVERNPLLEATDEVDATTQSNANQVDAATQVVEEAKESDSFFEEDKQQGSSLEAEPEAESGVPLILQGDTNVEAVPEFAEQVTSHVDTQEIIDQIGEYVKLNQSQEITEMEIALNPASLGNIHLQVAMKDGVITANITTDNAEVRDALMQQAMMLKEELNLQGLKVEAVEVSVGTHEFEQNLEQNQQQNQAQETYEQELRAATRHRIIVEDFAAAQEMLENEDLTDAERIQIDMMGRAGNSVNFTA